jgi:sugar phosphate isomerase/epimerase
LRDVTRALWERPRASRALVDLQDGRVFEALFEALLDRETSSDALSLLAELPSPRAKELLPVAKVIEALERGEVDRCSEAVKSATVLRDPPTIPSLVHAIERWIPELIAATVGGHQREATGVRSLCLAYRPIRVNLHLLQKWQHAGRPDPGSGANSVLRHLAPDVLHDDAMMRPVPRVPPFDREATYDDLVKAPDLYVAEIVGGELHATPGVACRKELAVAHSVLKRVLAGAAAVAMFAGGPPAHAGGQAASRNPIGIFLRCTGQDDPLLALQAVKSLGLDTVQVSKLPDRFYTPEGAREFAGLLRATGIRADSVVAVFPGESYKDRDTVVRTVGFRPVELIAERLAYLRKCVDFAQGIGAGLVTFHMGFLPDNPDDPAYRAMLAAVTDIAGYAATKQVTISLETGQETGELLAAFLDRVTVARVGVNFDPANLVIYGVDSPARALARVASRVTSVHVKDALLPESPGAMGREVRPGEGRAELAECFRILRQNGFTGALIVENYVARGRGTAPMDELRTGLAFLAASGWR